MPTPPRDVELLVAMLRRSVLLPEPGLARCWQAVLPALDDATRFRLLAVLRATEEALGHADAAGLSPAEAARE